MDNQKEDLKNLREIRIHKILNIKDLPFEVDNNYELVKSNEIVLIKQFIPFKSPIFVLKNVDNSGGNLKSGVYYVSIQYKLHDGTYTNNSDLSNPIIIVKSSYKEEWENFNGDYEEVSTNKHIELNIHNIDILFKQYKVNIIHKGLNINFINLFIADNQQ